MKSDKAGANDLFNTDFEVLFFKDESNFEPTLQRYGYWKITKIDIDDDVEFGICFIGEDSFVGDTILLKSIYCECQDFQRFDGKEYVVETVETIMATTLKGERTIQGRLFYCKRPDKKEAK